MMTGSTRVGEVGRSYITGQRLQFLCRHLRQMTVQQLRLGKLGEKGEEDNVTIYPIRSGLTVRLVCVIHHCDGAVSDASYGKVEH